MLKFDLDAPAKMLRAAGFLPAGDLFGVKVEEADGSLLLSIARTFLSEDGIEFKISQAAINRTSADDLGQKIYAMMERLTND